MKRVLVTGATGFIGPHLVKRLVGKGSAVRCLVRETSDLDGLKEFKPEFSYGDIMNPTSLGPAISGCDVVYHIAGLTKSVPAKVMWDVNEWGVRNVAEACAKMERPPVVVVLSSLAAAGPAPADRPLRETDVPNPVSKYGLSKRKGELAAFEFADQVPITIIRAPIVLGEGDLDGLTLFKCILICRLHMLPTLRNYNFSMIHADDLSNAMLLAAAKGERISPECADKGIYFAAAEENPSYAEYGRMIGRSMDINTVFAMRNFPMTVRIIGAVNELFARISGKAQIMNWDKTREALAGSWACSPERLESQLGFRTEMPLADRLSQTVRWYVEHGHLPAKTIVNQQPDSKVNPVH